MEHRYLYDSEIDKIDEERNMLKGNINCMCVSDNKEELYFHCKIAINRILHICSIVDKKFDDWR